MISKCSCVTANDHFIGNFVQEIHKQITLLNFHDCHAKIRQVDSQATVGDGVVIQVLQNFWLLFVFFASIMSCSFTISLVAKLTVACERIELGYPSVGLINIALMVTLHFLCLFTDGLLAEIILYVKN